MATNHPTTNDFIRLLTEHQIAIKGLILSMSPGCQDVNDILQDVNVVLWEKKDSYEMGTNYKAWAYAVTRIKVMQYWDHQRKLGKIALSNEFLESVADARAQEDTPGYLQDKLDSLNQCLSKLKPNEQQLVHARYADNITLEHYATQNGSTEGTMKVALYRIKRKLKSCVEKHLSLHHKQA